MATIHMELTDVSKWAELPTSNRPTALMITIPIDSCKETKMMFAIRFYSKHLKFKHKLSTENDFDVPKFYGLKLSVKLYGPSTPFDPLCRRP